MSDKRESSPRVTTDGRRLSAAVGRIKGWQKALLAVAALLMVAGLGMGALAAVGGSEETAAVAAPDATPRGATAHPGVVSGLLPGDQPEGIEPGEGDPPPPPPATNGLEAWSPAIFRLGFSFFAGFCVAYAVRTFLRLSLVVVGLVLLSLFGLQYAGLIEVNWARISEGYGSFVEWMGGQTASFQKLITGYLPSSASGLAGIAMGFRVRV